MVPGELSVSAQPYETRVSFFVPQRQVRPRPPSICHGAKHELAISRRSRFWAAMRLIQATSVPGKSSSTKSDVKGGDCSAFGRLRIIQSVTWPSERCAGWKKNLL